MSSSRLGWLSPLSLASLIVTSIIAGAMGGWFWKATVQPSIATTTGGVTVDQQLQVYEKRADDLEKLISLLLTLTAVYGIALGFNAYQQAKESKEKTDLLTNQAEKSVNELPGKLEAVRNEAKAEIKEFLTKMRSSFPVFGDVDHSLQVIMATVIRLLPVLDWSEKNYKHLTEQDKQQILFYEKTVASFEYFDLGSLRTTASEIYHALGNFYGLKFTVDGKNPDDWQRSRFYLEKALWHDRLNIGALNDRGILSLEYVDPQKTSDELTLYNRAEGRKFFEESARVDSNQQRPIYNLARMKHLEKEYMDAATMLTDALLKDRWQEKPLPRRRKGMLYNRACAWARLAESAPNEARKTELLGKSWADLDEAFRIEGDDMILPGDLKRDLNQGEDLRLLSITAPYAGYVEKLLKTL